MKSVFKAIILLMITFLVFAGCNTPQESSTSGSSDPQQKSDAAQVPFVDGINASLSVDSNGTGNYGDYWYTFWKDQQSGSASMTIADGGDSYTTTASNLRGGFVAGIGWETGTSNRKIYYKSGDGPSWDFHSSWGGAFGVYGWTKGNPGDEWNGLVEYYIIEQGGMYKCPAWSEEEKNGNDHELKGYVMIDYIPYGIYYHYREGFPCILGTGNFDQYISVRFWSWWTNHEGEIDMADHVAAWESYGMNLGPVHDYQILFTEMWSESDVNGNPLAGKTVTGHSSGQLLTSAPAPAKYHYLKNNWSGKDMTVANNSGYADVICQGHNPSWTSQQWRMEEITGGPPSPGATVRIKNIWSGKYLTVADTSDYADVKAQDLNTSWTSQEWIIDSYSLDIVKFKNVWSGKYLTVASQDDYADIRCQPLNASWTSQNWVLKYE